MTTSSAQLAVEKKLHKCAHYLTVSHNVLGSASEQHMCAKFLETSRYARTRYIAVYVLCIRTAAVGKEGMKSCIIPDGVDRSFS
jgi:hypothetical protein